MRRNPRATLGLSAVVAVLQAGVLSVFEWVANSQIGESAPESNDGAQSFDSGSAIGVLSGAFSVLVLAAVFGAILTGMLTLVITDDVLGHRTPLGALWTRVRPRLPRLIGLSFLIGLLQLLGLCLFVAPGIWLWGIWAVAVPAFMVEDLGAVAAMRRSRDLVRGTFWRVWGIRVLGVIVVGVISAILGVPFKVIGAALGGSDSGVGLPIAYVLLTSVGSILSMTFTAPLRAGIDALLYIDLRMRKEGLDIVLQERATRGATSRCIGSVGSVVRILSDPVSGHDARRAAQQELSRPEYHRDDPSALTRATDWILDQLGRLGRRVRRPVGAFRPRRDTRRRRAPYDRPGGSAHVGAIARPRRSRIPCARQPRATMSERRKNLPGTVTTTQALQEWLRATVRTLEDRDVLDPRPGRTADEIARTAGAQLPQAAVVLRTATDAFDAIWFGARPANAADAAAGRDAAVAVGLARIQPGPVEAPQYALPQ